MILLSKMAHTVYKNKKNHQRIAHNLVWLPIAIIGFIVLLLGLTWFIHPEPWLLDRVLNEALIRTSFQKLFSASINRYLPTYFKVIYKFLGLCLIATGFVTLSYVNITRLGTRSSRKHLYTLFFLIFVGVYYLIFMYFSLSLFKPILHILTLLYFISVVSSLFLKEK